MRALTPALLALLAPLAAAKMKYLGIAMAGIDFGVGIDGSAPLNAVALPLKDYGGADGAGQMKHFVEDDGVNTFRLPATWQFLVKDKLGSELDKTNFAAYDKLMQTCLDTGAYCMIDLHNFARYNGDIIGQGGPSNDVFADLWGNLATYYAKNDKIIFGLMNEPHDLDIDLWAKSCQAATTAIRKAGATSQIILLPGTNFASAASYVSTGSAAALANITNPDGSTDGLIFDLHQYLDINNSGTHEECTTNNVEGFQTIAEWLRKNKRTGLVSETGASMSSSCMTKFCQQNEYIAKEDDVFIGFIGWGAGSFDTSYIMTLTPTESNGKWTDNKLMTQCILGPFKDSEGPKTLPASSSSSSATSTPSSTSTLAATPTHTTTPDASKVSNDKESSGGVTGVSFLAGLLAFCLHLY